MFNNLGIFSNTMVANLPIIGHSVASHVHLPLIPTDGVDIGQIGNDTFIGGGIGPPGPPGTPGLVPVTIVTTTPFTAALANYFLGVDIALPSSIILPVSPPGTVFVVKDISGNASTNPITVTALGALIDGSASATINTNYGSITLVFNGTEWNII